MWTGWSYIYSEKRNKLKFYTNDSDFYDSKVCELAIEFSNFNWYQAVEQILKNYAYQKKFTLFTII